MRLGNLCQVVSELTTIVFCKKDKTEESCDLNSVWWNLKQCRQGDVQKELIRSSRGEGNEITLFSVRCYGDNTEINT
jgi:hypothetical protein